MNTREIKKHDRYMIGVDYSDDKRACLKKFTSIIGTNVAKFTAEALDNEIQARLDGMKEDERRAVEHLLQKSTII